MSDTDLSQNFNQSVNTHFVLREIKIIRKIRRLIDLEQETNHEKNTTWWKKSAPSKFEKALVELAQIIKRHGTDKTYPPLLEFAQKMSGYYERYGDSIDPHACYFIKQAFRETGCRATYNPFKGIAFGKEQPPSIK